MIEKFFKIFTKVFGSRNEREIRRILPMVQAINARVAGYVVVPCVWSAETAVAKRAAFLTMDHEVRPEEAPLG